MSRILVEARVDPNSSSALDSIADTCRRMSYKVIRWRGPFSGRVPYQKRVVPCELAVIFNGAHPKYARTIRALQRIGAKLLFVELGWHPQKGTIQIDPLGINARASWNSSPLPLEGKTQINVPSNGELLVVLQLDSDTQISLLSPWFPDMQSFVEHACRFSAMAVRVRAHPLCQPTPRLRNIVQRFGARWDHSHSLSAALDTCRAVACINSSSGVEALGRGLPVLCYGRAIYRKVGAVYCLQNCGKETLRVTSDLRSGKCELFRECQTALHRQILEHQWHFDQIPERLPRLIEQTLDSPLIGVDSSRSCRGIKGAQRRLRNWIAPRRRAA
jgi:hypothetical protein